MVLRALGKVTITLKALVSCACKMGTVGLGQGCQCCCGPDAVTLLISFISLSTKHALGLQFRDSQRQTLGPAL